MPTISPILGDPVLVDGTKYRIRSLALGIARLRAFGGQEAVVDPRQLRWDATEYVWRTDRCVSTR